LSTQPNGMINSQQQNGSWLIVLVIVLMGVLGTVLRRVDSSASDRESAPSYCSAWDAARNLWFVWILPR
jgi:hypothetical protein